MPTLLHCPHCQKQVRVPDELMGKLVRCPGCGANFTAGDSPSSRGFEPPMARSERRRDPDPDEDDYDRPRRRRRRRDDDYYDDYDDDFDRPRRRRPEGPAGLSVAGLVVGIVSLVLMWCCWLGIPTGVVGLILSAVAMNQEPPGQKGMAIGGLICSLIALGLAVLAWIFFFSMRLAWAPWWR